MAFNSLSLYGGSLSRGFTVMRLRKLKDCGTCDDSAVLLLVVHASTSGRDNVRIM
jgi:hypothetical protein